MEVKMSVVGYGRAEKTQVQLMVRSLLSLERGPAGRCFRCRRRRHLSRYAASAAPSAELADEMAGSARWQCACSAADAVPKVLYTKSFPGSVPAFVSVELLKNGQVIYKEAPDDENPVDFKLSPEDTNEIFALADKLDRFKRPLESNLKVANMGMKTFRFEDGAAKNETEVQFLPRRGRTISCSTGSNASPKPSGSTSTSSAPPSSTSSE